MIHNADVFQLFWSSNSMESDFVRHEWEYALGLRRPSFIWRVYWEEPMPRQPDRGLPPEDLATVHFQKFTPTVKYGRTRNKQRLPEIRPQWGASRWGRTPRSPARPRTRSGNAPVHPFARQPSAGGAIIWCVLALLFLPYVLFVHFSR
jgi:hypothetical protein